MSEGPTAVGAAQRVGSGASRLRRAWRVMPAERRHAAYAAVGLFLTLFLPWYQETVIASAASTKLQSASATLTGWGAFSFVEAAVLLVSAGVLTLLFQRAEGRAFHIPGGDGGVIMAAGLWACVLVIWRIFDKQGTSSHAQFATSSGIEWGIFVALAVAASLAYTGSRIRAAHRPEPPLPGEDGAPDGGSPAPARPGPPGDPPTPVPAVARPRASDPASRRPDPEPRRAGQGPDPEPRRAGQSPVRPPEPPRPRGWLTARPEDRTSEQLTIPLERDE